LALVRDWTAQAGLTLHPAKTRLVDARTDGFDFLGCHFEAGQRWPRTKSLTKFKDTIRAKTWQMVGRSLERVVADLNPVMRGWFDLQTQSGEDVRHARLAVLADGLVLKLAHHAVPAQGPESSVS
jgi:hypothetical protein